MSYLAWLLLPATVNLTGKIKIAATPIKMLNTYHLTVTAKTSKNNLLRKSDEKNS